MTRHLLLPRLGRTVAAVAGLHLCGCAAVAGIEDYRLASDQNEGPAVVDTGSVDRQSAAEIGNDDVSDAAAPDTLVLDTLAPDTLALDTLAPDTVTPDTLVPTTEVASDASMGGSKGCPPLFEAPEESLAVFVATSGKDGPTCGTRLTPCLTIGAGIVRAASSGRGIVAVASGSYVERVSLRTGIRVIGGFSVSGTEFIANCTTTARDLVVVQAPATESITIAADGLTGIATVERLTVRSKLATQVAVGESIYGVFARGEATRLTMRDVRIVVADGGAGASGAGGSPGANASGTCAPQTGQDGKAGAAGGDAAEGAFGPSGYVAPSAGSGSAGGAGANGTAGGAGMCTVCVACATKACVPFPRDKSCGAAGMAGCGGSGGAPGAAGRSGGSSVGVYAWDAIVSIQSSNVRAGNGGAGGAGGGGGAAGEGSKGQAGSPGTSCVVACTLEGATCNSTSGGGPGGAAGGRGGWGGRGGAGGGGAGGWSVALVRGGRSAIVEEGVTATTGASGVGAGGAKNGRAEARWP